MTEERRKLVEAVKNKAFRWDFLIETRASDWRLKIAYRRWVRCRLALEAYDAEHPEEVEG